MNTLRTKLRLTWRKQKLSINAKIYITLSTTITTSETEIETGWNSDLFQQMRQRLKEHIRDRELWKRYWIVVLFNLTTLQHSLTNLFTEHRTDFLPLWLKSPLAIFMLGRWVVVCAFEGTSFFPVREAINSSTKHWQESFILTSTFVLKYLCLNFKLSYAVHKVTLQ